MQVVKAACLPSEPTMPRYYFDFHDGVTFIDEEGVELENIDAARTCAIQSLGAIAGDDTSATHMNIRNGFGNIVLTANLTLRTEVRRARRKRRNL
jgi:hypothetical protein